MTNDSENGSNGKESKSHAGWLEIFKGQGGGITGDVETSIFDEVDITGDPETSILDEGITGETGTSIFGGVLPDDYGGVTGEKGTDIVDVVESTGEVIVEDFKQDSIFGKITDEGLSGDPETRNPVTDVIGEESEKITGTDLTKAGITGSKGGNGGDVTATGDKGDNGSGYNSGKAIGIGVLLLGAGYYLTRDGKRKSKKKKDKRNRGK